MRKMLMTLSLALTAVAMMAQQPVITFEKMEHDFGKINEADGRVTTIFTFKNEGMAPLVLSNVRASCGCTTPKYTREPVEPGQTGDITVTYNPNGRPGRFQKTVTVTSNATEATKRLTIKGEVIPKPAKPVNQYTVQMGDLSLKARTIDFGTIKKGEKVALKDIEYANLTAGELKVELATNDRDVYLISLTSLAAVKANETGKFTFGIDADKCPLYGPVEVYAYVVVNGKQEINDTYKLIIRANIVEDFSKLTIEQLQRAPIFKANGTAQLGKVAAGKVLKASFNVVNSGADPMLIRRVYTADKAISFVAPKSVKPGKKGAAVNVTINTKGMEKGEYSRPVTIICNDPQQPVHTLTLHWVVD